MLSLKIVWSLVQLKIMSYLTICFICEVVFMIFLFGYYKQCVSWWQNVSPAKLVSLLKERRTAWMNFNFTSHSTAFARAGCFAYPGLESHHSIDDPAVIGYSNYEDEVGFMILYAL